ncbi:hypothetical protein [Escherichia coli]|uniref:hypothetical protein n=1 Tax=Escherichia coli TaxID=562 RepID=UPI00388D59CB
MRFVAPVRTINAGPNRKYFGNNRGSHGTTLCPISISGTSLSLYRGAEGLYLCAGSAGTGQGLVKRNYLTDTAGASRNLITAALAAGTPVFSTHTAVMPVLGVSGRMDR